MRKRGLFNLVLFSLLAVFLTACGQPPTANNSHSSAEIYNAVNHNAVVVNANAVNSNAITSNTTNLNAANNNSKPMNSEHDMPEMLESSPDAANQPYDLQFIDTMIQHHQAAVVMAKMVLAKSQNQEFRKFAQKIITGQEAEIEQMEAWRDQWYPYKLDAINMELPGMRESMIRMVGNEMDKMQSASGKDFDNQFVEMMIPHHQGAVTMAKDALEKAQHPDLKALAQEIITAQEAEIKQMTERSKK